MYEALFLFLVFTSAFCANNQFPDDFQFGIASSAYQIEGGHDAKGKGESIWDYHLRVNPSLIRDGSNGNIACDSYNNYKEDIILLEELGVDFYRFSISWSRIMPRGYANQINQDGVRYYNELIDGLVAKNIQPMVTMYHFDLPKALQDIGGWTNPLLADYFGDYARVLFENFGDRVKSWITFNTAWVGYKDDQWPPRINQSGIANYLYVKNVLLAHAKAYNLYSKEFRNSQKGQVGLTVDTKWYEPASTSMRDQEAAERTRQFFIGVYINPIFGDGQFPKVVRERVDQLSRREGFPRSRFPTLTPEETKQIKGACDFIGLNVYTTFLMKDVMVDEEGDPSFDKDLKAEFHQDPEWPQSHAPWLRVVPSGMRKSLNWIRDTYGNHPIFVTENGFCDQGELDDTGRINYMKSYLKALLEAIHEDGIKVKGYAAWSLLDNFEWLSGYSERFGLHHVDFSDPRRKRTAKSSSKWYKNVIKRRKLDEPSDRSKAEL